MLSPHSSPSVSANTLVVSIASSLPNSSIATISSSIGRPALDALGQPRLDANRTLGQPNKITVIFGRKITKPYRGKLQTVLEDRDLPNPVIRSHYGHGFIQPYVRDHLWLRTEPATMMSAITPLTKPSNIYPSCDKSFPPSW